MHVLVSARPARLQETDKYRSLVKLLEREMDGSRILVFCETKRGCDAVSLCPQLAQCFPCQSKGGVSLWCPHLHLRQALGLGCYVITCRQSTGLCVPAVPAPARAGNKEPSHGWLACPVHSWRQEPAGARLGAGRVQERQDAHHAGH